MTGYDINMIRAFVLIYETGSVTSAADQLGISQPSVSYALRKMRESFVDELFVRSGQRMVPTRIADGVYARLRDSLATMDAIMDEGGDFDPAESSQIFRVQLTDIGGAVLLPLILSRLRREAPGISLEMQPLKVSELADDLKFGRSDAAICGLRIVRQELVRDPLFRQSYIGLCSNSHPRISSSPTLKEYLTEQHVAIGGESGHHLLHQRMLELGHTPTVSLTLPNFLVLSEVLADTELVAFAPGATERMFQETGKVRTFELPFEQPESEIALYTYGGTIRSGALSWLRETIADELRGLVPSRR